MTAVSQRLSRTALELTQHDIQSLRWSERGFVFEIRSSDNKLLEMAHRVLAVTSPAASRCSSRCWNIERTESNEDGAWLVSGESKNSSMVPMLAESREMAVLYVEQDALDWLLNNSTDTVTVHAALLAKNGKGIVIVGPSFAGKSTLATALWREGWSLMSDDLVFIDTVARIASPTPRRVSLRFESRELVGDSLWTEITDTPSCITTTKGLFFHPHEVSGRDKQRTTLLSAIFFLARRDTIMGPAEVRSINAARGALSLLPYAFNVRALPFVEGLRHITPLLDKVPAFDLGRGDLHAMINAVEVTVG